MVKCLKCFLLFFSPVWIGFPNSKSVNVLHKAKWLEKPEYPDESLVPEFSFKGSIFLKKHGTFATPHFDIE